MSPALVRPVRARLIATIIAIVAGHTVVSAIVAGHTVVSAATVAD